MTPLRMHTNLPGRARQKGHLAVEFALLLPTLMLLVFGAIEMGRLLWTHTVLQHATQAAARYAMVRGKTSTMPATALQIVSELQRQTVGMDLHALNVQITTPWPEGSAPGQTLQIQASYDFAWHWPVRFAASSVNLQAMVQTTMAQ